MCGNYNYRSNFWHGARFWQRWKRDGLPCFVVFADEFLTNVTTFLDCHVKGKLSESAITRKYYTHDGRKVLAELAARYAARGTHRDRIPLPNTQVSHKYTNMNALWTIVLTSTIGTRTIAWTDRQGNRVRGKSRPTDSARASGNYEPDLQSPRARGTTITRSPLNKCACDCVSGRGLSDWEHGRLRLSHPMVSSNHPLPPHHSRSPFLPTSSRFHPPVGKAPKLPQTPHPWHFPVPSVVSANALAH
jgi:hypothetical protein